MKEELKSIETQLSLLRSLPYVTAYSRNLKYLQRKSYVELYEITKKIGDLEKQKREFINENRNIKN